MARDVGDIYLEVHADTKGLKNEIRRAARQAGKDFGKDFGKEADKQMGPGLSALGNRARRAMGKAGRDSAVEFMDGWDARIKSKSGQFDRDIQDAVDSGDWSPLLRQFDSMDDGLRTVRRRLTELNREEGFATRLAKTHGVSIEDLRGQLNAYAKEQRKATKRSEEQTAALDKQNKAGRDSAAETKRRTANQKALAQVTDKTNKSMKAQGKELKQRLAARSAVDTKAFKDEQNALNKALQRSVDRLKDVERNDKSGLMSRRARDLGKEYDGLNTKIQNLLTEHTKTTKGMDQNSARFIRETNKTRNALKGFSDELGGLDERAKKIRAIKLNFDFPDGGRAGKEGFRLGRLFKRAFTKGSAGGSGNDFLAGFKKRWNSFLQAFPQGVTLLLRYFALLVGPISVLGSAIGGTLVAAAGSLYTALIGLAAAVGGVGVAAAYSMALAVKSFAYFKKSMPEVDAAITGLKDAFLKIDVPTFAQEWGDSLKGFADTLAHELTFDKVAENLGKATARITDAFTAVVASPVWDNFTAAVEGPLANAFAGVGTGMASLFGVALQWMTAAAPLAEAMGGLFAEWADGLNKFLQTETGQATMTAFLDAARQSLDVLVPLITTVADALSTLFLAGSSSGTAMLDTIRQLAVQFNAFLSSDAGQTALTEWFASSVSIFNALLPLLGAVGTLFADLVTPETVASMVGFMGALTQIMPILSQFFQALTSAGLLDVLSSLLTTVAAAVLPLIPSIALLASTIGDALLSVIPALLPLITGLVNAFIPLVPVIMSVVNIIAGALSQVLGALAPLFSALTPIIEPIISLIGALVPIIASVIQQIVPLLMPALQAVGTLFGALAPIITNLVSAVLPALLPVVGAIADLFTLLAPIIAEIGGKIAGLLVKAVTMLAPIIVALVPVVMSLVQAFMPFIDIVIDLAGVLLDALVPVIMALLPVITSLAPTIVQLVVAFVPVLKVVQLLAPVLSLLLPPISKLIVMVVNLIAPLLALIEPVLTFAASLLSGGKAMGEILGWFGKFGKVTTKMVEGVQKIAQAFLKFGGNILAKMPSILTKILEMFVKLPANIISGLVNGLIKGIAFIQGAITALFNATVDWFKGLFGIHSPSSVFAEFGTMILQGLINGLASMLSAIGTFFTTLFTTIGGWVVTGITAYITFWMELPGKVISAISSLVSLVGTWIGDVWAKIVEVGTAAWTAYISFWQELPGKIIGFVSTLVTKAGEWIGKVWAKIKSVGLAAWTAYTSFWKELPGKIIGFITGLVAKAGTWISNVWDKIKSVSSTAWTAYGNFWRELPGKVIGFVSGLAAKAGTWMGEVWDKIKTAADTGFGKVKTFFSEVPGKIVSAIGSVGSTLSGIGGSIIDGLLSGMKTAWTKVTSWVSGLAGKIADLKGPESYDKVLLVPAGGWIMQGLQKGLEGGLPDVLRAVSGITSSVLTTVRDDFGIHSPSKEFTTVGEALVEGLAVGVKNGVSKYKPEILADFKSIGKAIEGALVIDLDGPAEALGANHQATLDGLKKFSAQVDAAQNKAISDQAKRLQERRKNYNDDIKKQNDIIKAGNKKIRDQNADDRAAWNKKQKKLDAKDRVAFKPKKEKALKDTLPSLSFEQAKTKARADLKTANTAINKLQAEFAKQGKRKIKVAELDLSFTGIKDGDAKIKAGSKFYKATLADLAVYRDKIAARMEAQQKKLDDAIKIRDDFAASTLGALKSYGSVMNAVAKNEKVGLTATDIVTQMRDRIAATKAFMDNVNKLKASGLNDATLQEIIAGGVEGGGNVAKALVDGGKDAVGAVNDLQKDLDTSAKASSEALADSFYKTGIDSMKGMIKGLQDQDAEVTKQMKKIADNALAAFNKTLGIKSPSRKFATAGQQIMNGISGGMKKGTKGVLSSVTGVASKMTNAFQPSLTARASVSSLGVNPTRAVGNLNAAGGGTTVASGAIQIITPVKDPGIVASMVLDNLVARAR